MRHLTHGLFAQEALVKRLLEPPLPEILRLRKHRGEYVPRPDGSTCALLVALWLHEEGAGGSSAPMLSKDDLMHRAEATGIARESMFDPHQGGDNGPHIYDGWSSVKQKLLEPPLELGAPLMRRRGRDMFALSSLPAGNCGKDVAMALHERAHNQGRCRCGRVEQPGSRNHALHVQFVPAPSSASLAASSSSGQAMAHASPLRAQVASSITEGVSKHRKVVTCGKCGATGHISRNSTCPMFRSAGGSRSPIHGTEHDILDDRPPPSSPSPNVSIYKIGASLVDSPLSSNSSPEVATSARGDRQDATSSLSPEVIILD